MEVCNDCEFTFIGPTAPTIASAGDKVEAKILAKKLLPGEEWRELVGLGGEGLRVEEELERTGGGGRALWWTLRKD